VCVIVWFQLHEEESHKRVELEESIRLKDEDIARELWRKEQQEEEERKKSRERADELVEADRAIGTFAIRTHPLPCAEELLSGAVVVQPKR
jgi:hypothetical protein